jgi:hypothetical protein
MKFADLVATETRVSGLHRAYMLFGYRLFIALYSTNQTTDYSAKHPRPEKFPNCCAFFFFYVSLRSLQSVRRHSVIVVTGTVNEMQEIHPVKRLPCQLNRR